MSPFSFVHGFSLVFQIWTSCLQSRCPEASWSCCTAPWDTVTGAASPCLRSSTPSSFPWERHQWQGCTRGNHACGHQGGSVGRVEDTRKSAVESAAWKGPRVLPAIQLNETSAHFQYHKKTGFPFITFLVLWRMVLLYMLFRVAHSLEKCFPAVPLFTIV